MTRIQEIVAKTMEQYSAGDLEGMSNQVHPEIHFEISMPPNHPHYKFRCGNSRDEFITFLNLTNQEIEREVFEIIDVLVSKQRVAFVGHNKHRMKPLNKVAEHDFVWVFRLEDELIVEFTDIVDTALVGSAYAA